MPIGNNKPLDDPTKRTDNLASKRKALQRMAPTPERTQKTVYINADLLDKLLDFMADQNYNFTTALNVILADGLKGKKIPPRPRDRK